MPVQYKDYYKILGVARDADADAVKRAYRTRAKQLHPDRNSGGAGSDEKFKELSEAYAVLSDPQKRRHYDQLGSEFKHGQNFDAANGFENAFNRGERARGGGQGDFSEFFNFFRGFGQSPGGERARPRPAAAQTKPGASHLETELTIPLEEAYRGTKKTVKITVSEKDLIGKVRNKRKTYDIKIPPGIQDGQRIRLRGQGASRSEDLYIVIRIGEHPIFTLKDGDLHADLRIAPWEAALGGKIGVPTLDGTIDMKLPAGIRSGKRLRLRGRGYPKRGDGARGDLIFQIMIEVPETLTREEEAYFKKLAEVSRFNPRR